MLGERRPQTNPRLYLYTYPALDGFSHRTLTGFREALRRGRATVALVISCMRFPNSDMPDAGLRTIREPARWVKLAVF